MTEATADLVDPPRKPLFKRLLPILLPVLAAAVGAGTVAAGLWSPMSLLEPAAEEAPVHAVPPVTFVDVPRIVLSLPGSGGRSLVLTAMIDVDPAQADQARLLMPRITDAFNGLLAEIEPVALDRRGILEILRGELATRARFVLGDAAVRDLLITEFRIQ